MSEPIIQIYSPSQLSESSVTALRSLLGRSIFTIFTPNLDAAGAHLAAWKLSMLLEKDSFVTFECEWTETPTFLMDSWQIFVTVSSSPLGIASDNTGALLAPCTISMYGATPIRQISVYRFADRHENEAVQYDGTIVFACEGGRRFAIGCMLNGPGIATYLHFSENEEVIRMMLSESTERLVIS